MGKVNGAQAAVDYENQKGAADIIAIAITMAKTTNTATGTATIPNTVFFFAT